MYTKIKRTLTPFPRASNPYVLKKIYTCEHDVHKKMRGKFGGPGGGSYIYTVNDEVMNVVREFTCALTGENVRIVRLPDGNEIALGENEELGTVDLDF